MESLNNQLLYVFDSLIEIRKECSQTIEEKVKQLNELKKELSDYEVLAKHMQGNKENNE